MDKRTAMIIAAALVAAMMAGVVSYVYTLGRGHPVQVVVQNPAAPAAGPPPEGD